MALFRGARPDRGAPTLSINADVVDRYPRVAEAALERRWEFMGHSYVQMPIHQLEDQRATIRKSLDRLEAFTGHRPKGWLGPGLTETYETPNLLAEAGVQYVGDWVYDDKPTVIETAHGPLVTLPYTVELNNIPMAMVQHHHADMFLKRACDQFDRLYAEGASRAKILSIAIHPYITGVPHRIVSRGVPRLRARPSRRRILDGRRDARLVPRMARRRARNVPGGPATRRGEAGWQSASARRRTRRASDRSWAALPVPVEGKFLVRRLGAQHVNVRVEALQAIEQPRAGGPAAASLERLRRGNSDPRRPD